MHSGRKILLVPCPMASLYHLPMATGWGCNTGHAGQLDCLLLAGAKPQLAESTMGTPLRKIPSSQPWSCSLHPAAPSREEGSGAEQCLQEARRGPDPAPRSTHVPPSPCKAPSGAHGWAPALFDSRRQNFLFCSVNFP